ncbi:sodium-coupled monocarboxylate transporter 1 [Hyalella azteca]|uniref:Sodium-coupled monocarboxylate transporter 1 n=1 Tax=Hyalella azteca TaxID=294128 RepID=A0A979FT55_HYAAZ|nr:sodium-coupled monocarboxylate transporter 1 [Hyalella azteca]
MLGILDIILLAASLLVTLAIGVYHGVKGRKATPAEYMLGGRAMSPLPLAMSMMVGTISPITIMGNIGEMYAYGTQLWIMDVGLALGMVVVAEMFIPIFYPMHMVSLYQYIEQRFRSKVLRLSSVLITLLAAYLFIGFLLYPPSTFLVHFTGLGIIPNIVIMGLVCGLYSAFGGVKAVVHTDVVQSMVMLVGVLAIVVQCTIRVGGLESAWSIASERGRIEFYSMSLDPYQRHSFWLTLVFGFFFSLSTYGVNQSQTQRTFSTGSVQHAKRVIYYAIFGMLLLRFLINLAGVVIFAFYADCDPLTMGGVVKSNLRIVVVYVLQDLTSIPGLAGLFVASIYAAVLSSVSTQVNSMTALLWEDFLKNLKVFETWSEVTITYLQKLLVFLTGVIGIVMSLIATNSPAFISRLFRLTGAISGPMVGLFLTGLYLPWVKGKSAGFGFLLSIVFSLWIVTGQLLTRTDPPYLPMSHTNCTTTTTTNTTTTTTTASVINTSLTTAMPDITSVSSDGEIDDNHNPQEGMAALYGLSYCLNYCWGSIACLVLAALASLLAGWNTPDTIDERLIAPTAWKIFKKLPPPSYEPPLQKLARLISPHADSYATNSSADRSPKEQDGRQSRLDGHLLQDGHDGTFHAKSEEIVPMMKIT